MSICNRIVAGLIIASALGGAVVLAADDNDTASRALVQYGSMHEAIGQKQDQGRVHFSELLRRPHFYGVAALANLRGEATIYDGKLTITKVGPGGTLQAAAGSASDPQATMLAGAYVPSWSEHAVTGNVAPDDFDKTIADKAAHSGRNTNEPFVFTVTGEFTDVRLHVINGACPIHARLRKLKLPEEVQPFEAEIPSVKGTLVGVFAKDAVGDLTHPATWTHTHILYKDPRSGQTVTGHVEQVGLRKGAVLRLPK